VNVAAAVSLAGIGLDQTELRVIADPAIERDRHEVVVEGAFGRLEIRIENVPTEENPRTGRIVAMSVVAALLEHRAPIVVG
jgi:aspartate dehydrogenase